jgi:hypothetical protein
MKAITVKQPWASLIVEGIKDIENRTWKTNFRGRVLIHAGRSILRPQECNFTDVQWDSIRGDMRYDILHSDLPSGAIIGSVEIVDCVINHTSIWAEKFHKTEFCPECGCKEYTNENFIGKGYRNCTTCGQEWWTDVNYNKPIYNWVLANPIKFNEPIPCKGALSFWDYNGELPK